MIVRRSRLSVGSVSVRVVFAVGAAVALCLGLVSARAQNNGSKPVAHDRSVRVGSFRNRRVFRTRVVGAHVGQLLDHGQSERVERPG